MLVEELWESYGGKHASQAYWNALAKLRAAWKEVLGEDLPTQGNRAKDAFEQAITLVKQRLENDAPSGRRIRDILDMEIGEDIAEALLRADMDDLPPKLVLQVLRDECATLGTGRHELRTLLRLVLDKLFDAKTRRPRVGANRHWPRLLQYLRELEEQTDWGDDQGVRLVNAGGGGKVATQPGDPGRLAVRIDSNYLVP